MLISKVVKVRWNGFTRKHYESRGYTWTKQNDYFDCLIEDLQINSTVKVEVKCDYCEDGIAFKEYRNYLKEREIVSKDCCKSRKCMVKKSEEVNLIIHGVKNINQLEERKEKARKLFQAPMEEILNVANSKGLTILNINDYQNDRTRLFVICKLHEDKGIQETNFANIKKNKHCCIHIRPEIISKTRKLDGKFVYDSFLKNKLIPMFTPEEYKDNYTPLPYKCPNHLEKGIQYRSYSNLNSSEGCIHCARERISEFHRNDQDKVFAYFLSRGLKPLDNEKYINDNQKIKCVCENHTEHVQEVSYHSLSKTKVPCEYCRIENSVGKLNKRLRSSLGQWRKESEKNCNYKCVLTGTDSYDIHHTYSYNSIIKDALKKLNLPIKEEYSSTEYKSIKETVLNLHKEYIGVCIRHDLHIIFHQIYGKQGNTPDQFEEFKINYMNNKFEEVLINE